MSRKSKAERRALKDQWRRTLRMAEVEAECEEIGGTPRVHSDPFSVPDGAFCSQCKVRPAKFIFTEGTMAFVHGAYDYRCNLCILLVQYINIQEQIARLDEVKAGIDAEVKTAVPAPGTPVKIKDGDSPNGYRIGEVLETAWSVDATRDEGAPAWQEPRPALTVRFRVAFAEDEAGGHDWYTTVDIYEGHTP